MAATALNHCIVLPISLPVFIPSPTSLPPPSSSLLCIAYAPMNYEIERQFCSNFKCCNAKLSDLHALFGHLENCHGNDDPPFFDPSSPGTFSDNIWSTPPSGRKRKRPFTCVPLPPIPPLSPLTSESSSSVSTPEPSSASSSDYEVSPAQRCPKLDIVPSALSDALNSDAAHVSNSDASANPTASDQHPLIPPAVKPFMGPSFLTHENIYARGVPPIQHPLVAWPVPTPVCFYPADPLGFAYPIYHPVLASTPFVPPHAPTPVRPQGVPPHAEVIDVDQFSPPSPPRPPRALPSVRVPAPRTPPPPFMACLPPPPPSTPPSASCDAATLARASAATTSTLASAATTSTLASLRHRFFCFTPRASPPANKEAELSTSTDAVGEECLDGEVMQVDDGVGGTVAVDVEASASAAEEGMPVVECAAPTSSESEAKEVLVDGGQEIEATSEVKDDAVVDDGGPSHIEEALEDNVGDMDDDLTESDAGETESVSDISKPIIYLNGRPKLFVCPVPLCVKSYLNPNGLRYHARQGTCVTEDGKPCKASRPRVVAAASISNSSPASAGAVSPASTTTTTTTDAAVPAEAESASPTAATAAPRRPMENHRRSKRLAKVAKEGAAAAPASVGSGVTVRGGVKARSKAAKKKAKPAPTRARGRLVVAATPSSLSDDDDDELDMLAEDGDESD
ncbi:hypothetical protein C8R46DRAFT_1267976 [Mycena filopes]|nr:hypothetical protein C8R46DRAFT_1267976 [Mycena filopes]